MGNDRKGQAMGVGIYRGIVRGQRSACHAFIGMLHPTSYECTIDWQAGDRDDCRLTFSGTSKYGLHLSDIGPLGKYKPLPSIPEDDEEAKQAGIREMLRLKAMPSVQARSKICGVEVWLTQTDDEDREEEGDTLQYVHYIRGERQDDSHTDRYPAELDMPVGGDF
jgi:hypothetical protein